jgi:hypothetical protein
VVWVIKDNLVTQSPNLMLDRTRQLGRDETCILDMNTQKTKREGNSKPLLHANRGEKR